MVGIPFKIMDKKIEKKLLFSRRKELTLQLEEATNAEDIFDLAITLLYQQTRGIAVVGKEIKIIILKQLLSQKKIPCVVSETFEEVSILLENNQSISEKLLSNVKDCGLSKDIATYGKKG